MLKTINFVIQEFILFSKDNLCLSPHTLLFCFEKNPTQVQKKIPLQKFIALSSIQLKNSIQTKEMKKIQPVVIGEVSFFPDCVLGTGSTGKVYKGIRSKDNLPVAVKTVDLKDIDSSLKQHLLSCEIEALSQIKHPYVCETYHIQKSQLSYFMVMELCPRGTLKDYLREKKFLTEKEALDIFSKIIQGYSGVLDYGYLHRDLKAENILLRQNMDPVLIDFGYCEKLNTQNKKMDYNVGSPIYMSPQSFNYNFYSQKSDIWSLGVILHLMLTGSIPIIRGRSVKDYFRNLQKYEETAEIIENQNHPQTESLLRGMLTVDTKKRLDCSQISSLLKKHPLLSSLHRDSSKNTIMTTESFSEPYTIKNQKLFRQLSSSWKLKENGTQENTNSESSEDLKLSGSITKSQRFSLRRDLNQSQDPTPRPKNSHFYYKGSVKIQKISYQQAPTPIYKSANNILSKNTSMNTLFMSA